MNIRIARIDDLGPIIGIYNQAIAAGQKTADITPITVDDRKQWFDCICQRLDQDLQPEQF